ncbi:MAG: 23S rRNA (pseudouridine(1915)-N(3))-methyltransferase RlmH [Williamsia sp.]|nr:23S rRNA (pseudouridine(1915)-N(3))-methyltransferase RlmH [Williamsia sp.]
MKIQIWSVGKSNETYVKTGIEDYSARIRRYYPLEWNIIPVPKNWGNLSEQELPRKEAESILGSLKKDDFLVALDGRGKQITSEELAGLVQSAGNGSVKNLVFLIGGAYGLDKAVLQRANFSWSLSQLVFPHQLVRLILSEQLYRACTIIRNEKYHHP